MNDWALNILCCPSCGGGLSLQTSKLVCNDCGKRYSVVNGIPRFVENEAYCGSFGRQWNSFNKTQIDAYSGATQSEDRFKSETGWIKSDVDGAIILDAGCGAGRFSDIALKWGARIIAVDLSESVDACYQNLNDLGYSAENFLVIQASLDLLPLKNASFDKAFSLGVIQHTSDRKKCIGQICAKVKNGGEVAFWVYEKSWKNLIGYKYYFRIFTKHLNEEQNWALSKTLVNIFLPFACLIDKIPKAGRIFNRVFMPFAYRDPGIHDYKQIKEWSILDTFDNLSPAFDSPLTENELRNWLLGFGMSNIRRLKTKGLAMIATK